MSCTAIGFKIARNVVERSRFFTLMNDLVGACCCYALDIVCFTLI